MVLYCPYPTFYLIPSPLQLKQKGCASSQPMAFLWGMATFPHHPVIRFTHIQVFLGGQGSKGHPLLPLHALSYWEPVWSCSSWMCSPWGALPRCCMTRSSGCTAHAVNSPACAKETSRAVLCMQKKKLIVGFAAASRSVLHIPGCVETYENIFNHLLLLRAKPSP